MARANFGSLVNIYPDGTVSVTHGGTEIGQGINTKVCQVVAYELGVPMSDITIQESTTQIITGAANVTGGSVTSELCALSVIDAIKSLNERLAPVKKANPKATWVELIAAASGAGINLSSRGYSAPTVNPADPFVYNTYAAVVTEATMDVLTGQTEISRVDILFDCGISMNPAIDIGQVEGGFMQGIGYYTMEDMSYDTKTGQSNNAC
eukprot:gene15683-72_t